MLTKEEKAHYSRHLILPEIGAEGQLKLKSGSVLVLGAGGLGAPLLQYLTAAGVGKIGIVDDDVVSVSNLQRQVLYSYNQVGKLKADSAVERLKDLNPHVELNAIPSRFTVDNAMRLLEEYDVLVDGCDNFATRYLANDAAVLCGKPLVSGSIFKFEGQLSVFNYQGGPTYRCLYPEPPASGEMPSCGEIGVLGVLPGMIGTMMANEVIKILLEKEGVLSGKLYLMDALTMNNQVFNFSKVPAQAQVSELKEMVIDCEVPEEEEWDWSIYQKNNESTYLLDVRSEDEYSNWNKNAALIPLPELEDRLFELPTDQKIVIHCEMGGRARKAKAILAKYGYSNVVILLLREDEKG